MQINSQSSNVISTGLSHHFNLFNFDTGCVEIRGGSKAATKQRVVQLQENYFCDFDRLYFLSCALYTRVYHDRSKTTSRSFGFQWNEHKVSK